MKMETFEVETVNDKRAANDLVTGRQKLFN